MATWRRIGAALGLLAVGLAFGCGTRQSEPEIVYGVPSVSSIEVVMAPGATARLTAVVRGTVRDPCTRIGSVRQSLEGRVITILLTTQRALADSCQDAETPFEASVPLVERGLEAGEYVVVAGAATTVFVYRHGGVPEL